MSVDALKELLSKLSPAKRKLLALELMGNDGLKPSTPEPLAIVGMGCRFPGGANDPEAYWRLLREARNGMSEVPKSRWDLDSFYDPDPDAPGKMYVRESGFLRGVEVADFDAQFFGIAPPEAESLDPQQRLLLEVAWEALEHAGQAPSALVGSNTGVFVGVSTVDFLMEHLKRTGAEGIDAYWFSGTGFCVAAGRISYVLGLQGPAMAVDTMCSSSLVALQLACQHLRERRCDLALVGGVNVMVNPEFTVYCCKGRFVSADGRCKTFDASADGYARGEGCGVLVVKRLFDAVSQGDNILAVVRGTAVNEDGRSSSLTAPNSMAQRAVIREALANAGVSPEAVVYAEAHGTGTPLGDPIELQSLASVLTEGKSRPAPLPVGAAKTNVGHLEAGSGMAGIIKVILTLHHNELVPNLNLTQTNPDIALEDLRLAVPTERRPWPRHADKRIVSISAFAFQGTNSHVILEEPPPSAEAVNASERPLEVLTLSARSAPALRELARRYAVALREGVSLAATDVCFTANTGRTHFGRRAAILGRTSDELMRGCLDIAADRGPADLHGQVQAPPRIVLSIGGRARPPRLERELLLHSPVVRSAVAVCREAAVTVHGDHANAIEDWLTAGGAELALPPELAAAAELAAYVIMARLWGSLGVRFEVLAGEGVGEIAAAVIAQSLSTADGMRVAAAMATGDHASLSRVPGINAAAPRMLMVATATGAFFAGASAPDAGHWARSGPRASLAAGLAAAASHGCTVALDIAGSPRPHDGVAGSAMTDVLGWRGVVEAMARLYVLGCDLNWAALDAGFKRRKVRLPTYAFQRRRFWFEPERDAELPAELPSGFSADELVRHLEVVRQLSESDLDNLLEKRA